MKFLATLQLRADDQTKDVTVDIPECKGVSLATLNYYLKILTDCEKKLMAAKMPKSEEKSEEE